MTIKNFTKLSLSALLLAAATHSAIAEEATGGEVTLNGGKGATISWSAFVNALNDPSTIPADETAQAVIDAKDALDKAKKAYKDADDKASLDSIDAKKALNTYNASLDAFTSVQQQYSTASTDYQNASTALSNERNNYVKPEWLTLASEKAFNVANEYNKESGNTQFWYKTTSISSRQKYLDITYTDPNSSDWKEIDQDGFFTNMVAPGASVSFTGVRVYLGSQVVSEEETGYKTVTYSEKASILDNCYEVFRSIERNKEFSDNQSKIEQLENQVNTLYAQTNQLKDEVAKYTTKDANNQTRLDRELAASKAAQKTYEDSAAAAATAKIAMETAQSNYDNALQASKEGVEKNYKNVILTSDVTANEAIVNFDGTFEGNGYVITLSGIDNLFTRLTGANVSNVAINDGNIFGTQSNAAFHNVAAWTGTTGNYYDDGGERSRNINSIGELGYMARDIFGADLNNGNLVYLGEDNASRVYNITVYAGPGNPLQAYVNKKDDGFYNADSDYRNAINTFIKSETNDFGDLPNVFFTDKAGNSTCDNVVITDKNDFYCPFDIKATKVSYIREFKAGENTVCLPFKLEETANPNIRTLCRYERETADKFYFKKIAGSIPANTPFLLFAQNPFSFETFGETTIKQTPAEQIVMDAGNAEDPSKCFGTLRKTGIQEFLGKYNANKIYVLSGSKFKPADPEASSAAFRLAIASEIGANNNVQRAPRLIGILDEKGIEITDDIITGVENVAEENSSLNIAGGQGEIVITSDADYGKVEVYTMAGGVAAVADVMAGTTSVSLQKGIYIVMGKKVMVK